MYGFALARLAHAGAYLTKQSHEVRATFYTFGSVIVIFMAAYVLWALI
jgi:glutathione S-transferase